MHTVVKPEDELWILGDFAFGPNAKDKAKLAKFFEQLPGTKKHLVMGNHEMARAASSRDFGRQFSRFFNRVYCAHNHIEAEQEFVSGDGRHCQVTCFFSWMNSQNAVFSRDFYGTYSQVNGPDTRGERFRQRRVPTAGRPDKETNIAITAVQHGLIWPAMVRSACRPRRVSLLLMWLCNRSVLQV